MIQLQGRGVAPGFIDSHTHAESTAEFHRFWIDLHSPPMPAEHSSTAIMKKLGERVAQVPPGTWVVGQGPFGTQVPPTATELSVAFPNHPVVVKYGMHQYVANHRALEMANITKFTPDPPGAKIERGKDGEPTGMLYECFELFPIPYARADLKQALASTLTEDFLKQGVTTVYELTVTPAANGLYQELHDEGKLPVRLQIGYMIYPALQPIIDLESLLRMWIHTGLGDDWLRSVPPSCSSTARAPACRSSAAIRRRSITALRLHAAGWQLWLHAIGAPAQDMAIEALETVLRADPRPDPRHRLEHIGGELDPPRFDRMKRLGIIPVPTEPSLPYGPGGGARGNSPTVRYPYHTMLVMGLQPPGNSDTGGSYSWQLNVIARLAMFVTRATEDGTADHPEEAMSVRQALRILSTYSAYAGFEEKTRGTLEPGKLADLVVLSEDPLTIAPARLKDLKIDATIVDGDVRYERR